MELDKCKNNTILFSTNILHNMQIHVEIDICNPNITGFILNFFVFSFRNYAIEWKRDGERDRMGKHTTHWHYTFCARENDAFAQSLIVFHCQAHSIFVFFCVSVCVICVMKGNNCPFFFFF